MTPDNYRRKINLIFTYIDTMSHQHKPSRWFISVAFALLGNGIITVLKFVWFLLSGSGAMFSEAIHSFADTLNQSFLMIGIQRSTKAADRHHVYGFRKERFFWALISACGIFFIWAGVTTYHGILSIFEGKEILLNTFILIVLAISLILEWGTFAIAIRELIHANPHKKFRNLLKHGDPITLAVIYEDGLAVLWVLIATTSLLLYQWTGNHIRDSIGSIVIWVLLWVMAIFLISKNRKFLIGTAIPEDIKEGIIELLEQDPLIEKVLDFKSNILDLDTYHIKCEIECNGTGLMKEIGRNNFLKNEYEEVKENYSDFLEFCIDYAGRVPRIIGTRIDTIEKKIKEKFPQVRHIDIEIN